MRPRFETGALWDSRKRYPAGLAPPFEGSPQPEADVILLKPSYPKDPFPQKLRPGWNLVAAGTNYALFAKETPLLSAWIGKNRLSFYNPYSILPDGFEPRRKALDEALRLLEGDPRFFQALRDAGRMETDFQLPDAAARHLRKAVEIAPKDSELWNDLGAALQIGGDQKGAMEAYGRSLALKPSELLPRFNMASLLLQAGRPQDAEDVLKAVIAARPRAYIAYRRLAQVLVSEGKRDEAKEVLAKIPSDMRLPEDEDILGGAK
jgi:tetratricopeptide (TPR) repeat protein